MDNGNTARSGSGSGTRWLRAAAWLLGILALVLLMMGTLFRDRFTTAPAEPFNPVTVIRGSYVYLDATGIGSALDTGYSGGTSFFCAEDAGGYLYIVSMEPSALDRMAAQHEWWNTRSGEKPQPYRIYGSATQMSAAQRSGIARAMGVDTQYIDDYFGQKYLDTVRSPLDMMDIGVILLGSMMMAFSLFILIFSRPFPDADISDAEIPDGQEPDTGV